MVLRLMLKKKSFDRDPNTDSPWTFDLLCKHAELLSESKKEGFGFQITGIMKMCERNKYIRVENTREVFSVLCRLSCNTFSVLNTDMNPVGEGVYILPSFLNHSCQPNCTVVFDGLKMDVRSVVDIKPGQQLYISYTDLLDPPNKRQEVLRSTYYFSCHCQRCSVALCLDPLLTSVLCAKCQNVLLSNDKVPPLLGIHLCTCGESTEMVDTRAQRLSEEFDSLTKENQAKDKGRMERLISFQSRADKVLSPYHNLSIRIKEKIMDLAIDLCEWEVAFRVGSSLTQFYRCECLYSCPCVYNIQLDLYKVT
jgi:SET and MYND domain-containing protein